MIILDRPALAPLTTLRLGGRALAEIRLESTEDCLRLSETLRGIGGDVRVLGGGSNLLIHDGDLPFTVLRPLFGAADAEPVILGEEKGPDGECVVIRAGAGIDIGGTLIGMHLRPVAVPVRLSLARIGEAGILCARTRPKYIGGSRAVYQTDELEVPR